MVNKYLAVVLICLALFSVKSFAYDKQIEIPPHEKPAACQSENQVFIIQDKPDQDKFNQCPGDAFDQVARRGCCSHHKGVCGCSSDSRVQCCDGSLSPSCGC